MSNSMNKLIVSFGFGHRTATARLNLPKELPLRVLPDPDTELGSLPGVPRHHGSSRFSSGLLPSTGPGLQEHEGGRPLLGAISKHNSLILYILI
jgi:hypothetical protein